MGDGPSLPADGPGSGASSSSAGASSLGAIPKKSVPSSVPVSESGETHSVPAVGEACSRPSTVVGMGPAQRSQAPEDQVDIIREMCRHVEQVIGAFDSQDSREWPVEACQAVDQLKGKMIRFASQVSAAQEEPEDESAQDTGLSGSEGEGGLSSSSSGSNRKKVCLRRSSRSVSRRRDVLPQLQLIKSENASLEERFIMALEKLDRRTVPAPEPYDLSSGQSFSSFLLMFEDYCQHSFRGSDSKWIPELGRYLVGDMYQAFVAHKSHEDSYSQVKNKLRKWYRESKSRRQAGSKAMFGRATMGVDESVRLFASRLENLFRQAFPRASVESSRTLLDKFLKSIPRKYRKQVKSAVGFADAVGGKQLGWYQIVKLVGGMEEALTSDVSSDDERSSWTVMRSNVRSADVSSREAATQCESSEGYGVRRGFSEEQLVSSGGDRSGARGVVFGDRERSLARVCHFCGKLGHFQRECRRRLGLCLGCGSQDHQVVSCHRRQMGGEADGVVTAGRLGGDFSGPGGDARRVHFRETMPRSGGEASPLNSRNPGWRESPRK